MPDVFVGRQPIFDRHLDVVAYELLFRSSHRNWANITDGEYATSQVIHHAIREIGLESLVGSKRAFVNLTRDFILQGYMAVLPTDRVVLEVLEDIVVDAELIEAVRALSHQGYTIALDDFVFHEQLRPLVEIADIIKVDVLALDRSALRQNVARLGQYDVELLAEKVETHDDLACCQDLGFDYFQGYFLCEPDIVTGQ
jgi:c-di-GMP phosphodiesterase